MRFRVSSPVAAELDLGQVGRLADRGEALGVDPVGLDHLGVGLG